MKFSIAREILLEALNNVSKGLSSKTPLPVLTGIKIETNNNKLILTTTNREISIQACIENEESLVIENDGWCVVPGKYFIDIAKKIDGKKVEFSTFEENTIKILSDRSNFTLIALEKNNYPVINFEPIGEAIQIKASLIKQLIKQTAFAAGSSEARITLTGVCLELENNKLKAIATDSYRLAKKEIELENNHTQFRVNVPSKALEELCKIIDDDKEDILMYVMANKVLFVYKDVKFVTRLIEGSFPDTSSLFPKAHLIEIVFDKNALISTVDRASLFTNMDSSSIVKFIINNDQSIQISSNSNEIGKVVDEVIPLKSVELPPFQIAFSAKYFLEALKVFESSQITIKFTGEIKPFAIEAENDPNLIQLILPVRVC